MWPERTLPIRRNNLHYCCKSRRFTSGETAQTLPQVLGKYPARRPANHVSVHGKQPELREARGEIERARAKKLPKLVQAKDLHGILHAHTDASDGAATLQDMADAVRKRGYQYFGVTDHSKTAHYAGGLSVDEIDWQHAEIDRLAKGYGGIFKGIESDILSDGSLDYPDEVLRRFDFIVASVHGQFRLDRAKQTERILKSVKNPFVTILGHMTGRQLLRRPGYEVDIDEGLREARRRGRDQLEPLAD